ncbi:FAD/NAD(P)-binding domain-containing protein [Fomes fomentarius]|nr:FAD/NAD(P)-binding domain-containing protein [Fomes fomentarius]
MPGGGFSRVPKAPKPINGESDGIAPEPHSMGPQVFTLGDFAIDEYKPIKVVVIGAGFSGILAGIRFPQKIPNVDLVIYEKSAGVGGTWFNNRYPGIACDVPAHCYQYTFEDKRDWSAFYAPGHEIQAHLEDVVDKYKVRKYIKLRHEVVHARYDEPTGKWHIRIRRPRENSDELEEFEDVADMLVTAFGAISRWKMPDFEGAETFKGELHHTAGWNPEEKTWVEAAEKWKDKRVGVIGVGSSAIQTVAALQPRVAKVANYVRGQTWLALPFAREMVSDLVGRDSVAPEDNLVFTPEEVQRFTTDDKYFWNFRRTLEVDMNSQHSYTQKGSKLSKELEEKFRKSMMEKLANRPDIAERLVPSFSVSCRRLTPGPNYLEALCSDNVDFVTTSIKRFTENGIETEDGDHQELDIVFCATGYDTSWQLPFDIIGRNGVNLNEKWKPHPTSYLSMCVDEFPNMFMCLGPNSILGAGLVLPVLEYTVMYAVQVTAKMQRERLKSIEAKPEVVRAFDDYIESYFPRTVYSENCRSWYKCGKAEGRIVGLWPGSGLHALKALEHPRWEDYIYEKPDNVENPLHWLGDGQTFNEKNLTGDRAWYLSEEFIDPPPIPQD